MMDKNHGDDKNGNETGQNDTDTDKPDESDSANESEGGNNSSNNSPYEGNSQQVDAPKERSRSAKVRDLLIFREINNERLPTVLPPTCKMIFDDPNELHIFRIKVMPNEGYWNGGIFFFNVVVPDGYNFEPPKVKCATRLWHPNINEEGAVCLSILRSGSIDETGWNPARQLKDVVLGVNSLFTDLVNFHDPLNHEAAEMFIKDPLGFQGKVKAYIREFAQNAGP